MKRAVDHANRVYQGWSAIATSFLMQFIHKKETFMTEDLRAASEGIVPEPPHTRAWGSVVNKAARAGVIERVGFAPTKNPTAHKAPVGVWRKKQDNEANS